MEQQNEERKERKSLSVFLAKIKRQMSEASASQDFMEKGETFEFGDFLF